MKTRKEVERELKNEIKECFPGYNISLRIDEDNVVHLDGVTDSWDDVVDIGLKAGKPEEVHSVVNDLSVKGLDIPRRDYAAWSREGRSRGVLDEADVLIIGAGICGCAVARELSRLKLSVAVAEAGEDVAVGTTRANNGDIHPRNKYSLGRKKFEYCLRGNALYTKLGQELGFTVKREGYLYIACEEKYMEELREISRQDWFKRVPGAALLSAEEIKRMEPCTAAPEGFPVKGLEGLQHVKGGISYPTGGSVDPYLAAVALAENALKNGVRFHFDAPVCAIDIENGRITGAVTRKGLIRCRYIINCAGLYTDDMAMLAGDRYFTIHGRKGTEVVFDRACVPRFNAITTVLTDKAKKMKASKKMANSKGGGMDRTVENNVLIGASAKEVWDKEDTASDRSEIDYVLNLCDNPELGRGQVIRCFTGVRAADYKEDFMIEPSLHRPDMIHVAGIQSPGLTSAPAIAEDVSEMLKAQMKLLDGSEPEENPDFDPIRPRPVEFRNLSPEERAELISRDPAYGHIICRCETVTEGEIRDAINSPLKPRSLDAVKRRTRAGMGRCQSGFCSMAIAKMLAEAQGISLDKVTKFGGESYIISEVLP